MKTSDTEILEADFELGYTYTRTLGETIGKFLAALKEKQLYGIRAADGKVIFPPTEYDPRDSSTLHEFVPIDETGTVAAWTWIDNTRPHHNVDKPFAFALIKLNGADTPFLHRLYADDPATIRAGMAVSVQWREKTTGSINDIDGFIGTA